MVGVAAWFESLFLYFNVNWLDESWPLYAAMRLEAGGTLYQDVFFIFPPGHLLAGWIGWTLAPPGLVVARIVYSVFNLVLVAALYVLGRRIMPGPYAVIGALLVGVATANSHLEHLLFGYRYLVWAVLALLCFARRLDTGKSRWMGLAGVFVGIALCFRISPALAATGALGVATLAASRSPRRWLADGLALGLGVLLAVAPAAVWLGSAVGLDVVWREVFVRPLVMTDLQSLPVPALALPEEWTRDGVHDAFIALLFRVCALVYFGCAAWLLGLWLRSLSAGRRFEYPLLLAVVIWGGVYYLRSLGRSDEPHLSSTIPG